MSKEKDMLNCFLKLSKGGNWK